MNTRHDESHEALLEKVLAGDAPEARLGGCGTCARRLDELREVAGLLDGAASEERAILDEALRPPASRRAPRTWYALAAAAVLAISVLVWRPWDRPERGGTLLGDGGVACLAPVGPAASFSAFLVDATLPPMGWIEIRVFDEAAPGAEPVLASPRLDGPRWTPLPAEIARLPARIRWRARAFDATGTLVGSCESQASLSR